MTLCFVSAADHGTDTYPSSRLSLSRQSSLTDILEGVPPVFSEKPKDKDVDEGKPVELVCKVTGIPEPKVTFSISFLLGSLCYTTQEITLLLLHDALKLRAQQREISNLPF